jgi:hypothetical protein
MFKKRSVGATDTDEAVLLIPVTGKEEDAATEDDAALDEGTSATDGVATEPAATDENQEDAQSQLKALRLQFEEQQAKYEKDVGAVKSALDKKFADANKAWEAERKKTQKMIEDLRKTSMSEDERKSYEQQLASEQIKEYERKFQELEQARKEQESKVQWLAYFTGQGIPINKLNMEGNFAEFFASGQEALMARMKELEDQVAKSKQAPTVEDGKKKGKTPPSVITPDGNPPAGLSKQQLADKYAHGSMNELYDRASREPEILKLLNDSILPK